MAETGTILEIYFMCSEWLKPENWLSFITMLLVLAWNDEKKEVYDLKLVWSNEKNLDGDAW